MIQYQTLVWYHTKPHLTTFAILYHTIPSQPMYLIKGKVCGATVRWGDPAGVAIHHHQLVIKHQTDDSLKTTTKQCWDIAVNRFFFDKPLIPNLFAWSSHIFKLVIPIFSISLSFSPFKNIRRTTHRNALVNTTIWPRKATNQKPKSHKDQVIKILWWPTLIATAHLSKWLILRNGNNNGIIQPIISW